ncbi:MAG TPA: hypothetical protein VFV99_24970 [Kofleriaceae bacterium]|nr:hypothetical protein [Kofleriaceae bacterium]
MKRVAIASLLVAIAHVAHADTPQKPGDPPKPAETAAKQPAPDEIADIESREANLESNEPRKGFTFAGAVGGSISLGDGVGRGPALSLRLGHVATRKTVITFELGGSSSLHKRATTDETLTDSNFGLMTGAQRYTSGSFWVRAAGGVTFLVKNAMTNGTGGDDAIIGAGGLVGAGLDLARWGYLVLGLEGFGMASASSDGMRAQLAFQLGLSYY